MGTRELGVIKLTPHNDSDAALARRGVVVAALDMVRADRLGSGQAFSLKRCSKLC